MENTIITTIFKFNNKNKNNNNKDFYLTQKNKIN